MRKLKLLAIMSLLALAVGMTAGVAVADDDDGGAYKATLRGANEVPARATAARGVATFHLGGDEDDDDEDSGAMSLRYKLTVSRITNVVAAHIHCGPVGINGPVAVGLYGNAPAGGGPIQGTIAKGTIDLTGLLCPASSPAGLAGMSLLAAMNAGMTYVNVHTNDGVGATNTGPGDFPGGEIRGQVIVLDDDDD